MWNLNVLSREGNITIFAYSMIFVSVGVWLVVFWATTLQLPLSILTIVSIGLLMYACADILSIFWRTFRYATLTAFCFLVVYAGYHVYMGTIPFFILYPMLVLAWNPDLMLPFILALHGIGLFYVLAKLLIQTIRRMIQDMHTSLHERKSMNKEVYVVRIVAVLVFSVGYIMISTEHLNSILSSPMTNEVPHSTPLLDNDSKNDDVHVEEVEDDSDIYRRVLEQYRLLE